MILLSIFLELLKKQTNVFQNEIVEKISSSLSVYVINIYLIFEEMWRTLRFFYWRFRSIHSRKLQLFRRRGKVLVDKLFLIL